MTPVRDSFSTFSTCGELLKFLRRRAQLSQRELSIAVGYSESHISRIEKNKRAVDRTSLLALFVPALYLQEEPEIVDRLLSLCAERPPLPSRESTTPIIQPIVQPSSAIAPPVVQHALPAALTSFIGRQDEIAEMCELLQMQQVRLLTLTGAGGCGKTRLVLSVGEELAHHYQNGVRLVELAPLGDPQLLPHTVATAFGLSKVPVDATLASLIDLLHLQRMLLILDNCEHLVDAVAHLAAQLLQACPQLQILATSREVLAVPGEFNYRVQPLALPPSQLGVQPSCAEIAAYDAIQLFVERARTAVRTFSLTDQNAPAVARICQRLDGIPLGIELAAAWVYLLSPTQIADRLEQNFDLLIGGGRTVLPRHQTLRAAMDWSYHLLSEKERVLLRRLAVFRGGWSLEAAEAVVTDGAGEVAQPLLLTRSQLLPLLNQLVNKSMVVVQHLTEGEVRYRLLVPLREYLHEELVRTHEEEAVRNRHLVYFVALAEAADLELHDHHQEIWLERLERDHANLRAAINWHLITAPEMALQLATALSEFWYLRGHYDEGRVWLTQSLSSSPTDPSVMRGRALVGAGKMAWIQGDYVQATSLAIEGLNLFHQLKDMQNVASALNLLGLIALYKNEMKDARSLFEQALVFRRKVGNQLDIARTVLNLGLVAMYQKSYPQAKSLLEESLAISRLNQDRVFTGVCLTNIGYNELYRGNLSNASTHFREAISTSLNLGDRETVVWCLEGFAAISGAGFGNHNCLRVAASLFGAAKTLRDTLGIALPLMDQPYYEASLSLTRTQMSEVPFSTAWAEGAAMTLEQAVAYALADDPLSRPAQGDFESRKAVE